jgi:hypothetical protein
MELNSNVIYSRDNEKAIGQITDIQIDFIKNLEHHIKNDSCIEEFIDNLETITDFIKELEKAKEENGDVVVKCWWSNMGGYEYELIDF